MPFSPISVFLDMLHFRDMLTVAAWLCILSLTAMAIGLHDLVETLLTHELWQALIMLAILVSLSILGRQFRDLSLSFNYKDAKLERTLSILRSTAPVTIYNMVFTLLNFLWWRPMSLATCIALGVTFNTEIQYGWYTFSTLSPWKISFSCLFIFKFLKVIVHTISYLTYKPRLPSGETASYSADDVTVIIPSIDNFGLAFTRCVKSVLDCKPAQVFIATVESKKDAAEEACRKVSKDLKIITIKEANKRAQFLEAVSHANTKIIATADDQVYWGPNFLKYALSPFDDAHVGMVGTVKRVDRDNLPMFSMLDIVNYISVILLERHNFERTATCNIDGGVSGISGRSAIMRAELVKDPAFKREYLNETWFYGRCGPLIVDDDKFVSRWCWSHGWKTIFYNHKEALMKTSIAVEGWPKLSLKMHRWARTSWRGNSTELFVQRSVWKQQPWCIYATYFATSVNIALVYDSLLWLTLFGSGWGSNWKIFSLILFASKMIKPLPHLLRRKRDMVYIPIGILFGYYHSFIRLRALATAFDISWGSRDLKAASAMAPVPAASDPLLTKVIKTTPTTEIVATLPEEKHVSEAAKIKSYVDSQMGPKWTLEHVEAGTQARHRRYSIAF